MADAPLRLVADPAAVAADVLGQTGRTGPIQALFGGPWEDRRLVRPSRWDLDQRLVDQYRHRIEVAGVGLQAETLRLQRDRAATGERIQDRRRMAVAGVPDLLARPPEDPLIVGVLPLHQVADDVEQLLAPLGLCLESGVPVGMGRRIVDELCEQDRAGRGERPARPPQVQRGRVAVADRLLPRGLAVDVLQRERDLDELAFVARFLGAHRGGPPRSQLSRHAGAIDVTFRSPNSTPPNGSVR